MSKSNSEIETAIKLELDPVFSGNLYEHNVTFMFFLLLCVIYMLLGIIIGGLFELTSQKINKKYGNAVSVAYQILINAMFMSIVRYYIFPLFIVQLQMITYGLLFTATYFGVQFSLYTNSLKLLKSIITAQ